MLSRKQKWRRVNNNSNRRARRLKAGNNNSSIAPPSLDKKAGSDHDETCTASTSWSSFDSDGSNMDDVVELQSVDDYDEIDLAPPGLQTSPEDCRPLPADGHGSGSSKGVTFEPRVQVFLVTHKSELDTRAKQALWWTGKDAAINKRAWLNHLGQPGCGRQSVISRPRAPSADLGANDDDIDLLLKSRLMPSHARVGDASRDQENKNQSWGQHEQYQYQQYQMQHHVQDQEPVESPGLGILGCRCMACQTEGDDHDHSPPAFSTQEYIAHRVSATAAAANGGGGGRRGRGRGITYPLDNRYFYAGSSTGYGSGSNNSKSWPSETYGLRQDVAKSREGWRGRDLNGGGSMGYRRRHDSEELGFRSFSPASQSTSPLHDTDDDVFSNSYFWDR